MATYIRLTDYKQRARAFEEIGREVVQSVAFVLEKLETKKIKDVICYMKKN